MERASYVSVARRKLHLPTGEELKYEVVGTNPTVLFITGIHGDESRTIWPVRKNLDRAMAVSQDLLGNMVRVFHANPEAILAGTRGNAVRGEMDDLERAFPKSDEGGIFHPRARLLTELLKVFPDLEYVFSFHEDTYYKAPKDYKPRFYMYDIPPTDDQEDQPMVNLLSRQLVKRIKEVFGADIVHTGIDAEDLQFYVVDGYVMTSTGDKKNYVGDFESWAVEMGRLGLSKVKRGFIFEIPTDLPIEQKDKMVAAIINEFIIPFLRDKQAARQ